MIAGTAPPGRDAAPVAATPPDSRPPGPLLGRRAELDALVAHLRHGEPPVVNVTGSRGVGKSELIRAAASRTSSRFVEVVHLDLTGETPTTALTGLRRHLSRLPVPLRRGDPSTPAARTLLALDRADVLAHSAAELVELVPADTVTIVVESVPALRAPGVAVVQLGPLSPTAADELFRRTAEAMGTGLADDEATTAYIRRVGTALDANPLAIELAAARLPFLPLPSLVAALESPGRALAVLSAPHPSASALRTGLADSRRATSAASQRLLDLLSVFAGSFTIEAVEAVWAGDTSQCFDALTELIDLRLVELDGGPSEGRCRLSRLVRDFTTERIAGSALEEQARHRHADHYCAVARRAALADDDADEDAAHAILAEDYAEALAAAGWLRARDPAGALRLAADLGWEADRRGGSAALVQLLEELTCTEYAGAESARCDALLWLARLTSWSPLGADRVGLVRRQVGEATELARQLDNPLTMLHALRVQFLAIAAHGDLAAGAAACREAIELASQIGHTRWLGRFEVSLSAIHALLHEYDVAVELASSGLARATRSGDRRGMALGSLALHAMPAEQVESRAELPSLTAVLAIFEAQGDLQNEVHTLATLAQEAIDRREPHVAARWVVARQSRLGRADQLNGLTVSVMLAVHIARLCGDHEASARLHGSVSAHMKPLLAILAPRHVEQYGRGLESLREELGPEEFETAVAAGRLLDREQTLVELVGYLGSVVSASQAAVGESTVVRSAATAATAPTPAPAADGGLPQALTPREDQVLRLLARGLRNKEIAVELGISPKSVMHHTGSIYRRLGVRGRTEAVATAARRGLVDIE